MPISINSSFSSLQVNRQLSQKTNSLDRNLEKASSGKEINRASDDPAGLAVAMQLLTEADTGAVAARNISDGVSLATIADGGLESAGNILQRMSELATQSANGTLNDTQRQQLNNEYQSLQQELNRIGSTTEFNGIQVLSGNTAVSIQAGTSGGSSSQVTFNVPGLSSSNLGLAADISTAEGAKQAIDQSKAAIQSVAAARGEIGTGISKLETAFENIKTNELNTREASGRILDADMAKVAANITANSIGQQAAAAVQAQANIAPRLALQLLNPG